MKRLITDDYPCETVRYWLKCNSGTSARVLCRNDSTMFISEYGETLTFDHVLDFNDYRMYDEWSDRDFSIQALCGKKEEWTKTNI